MKIAGIFLIIIGLVDLIGSYSGFDLWGGFLNIQLPELLWRYSAYIELLAGYFLFKGINSKSATEVEEAA